MASNLLVHYAHHLESVTFRLTTGGSIVLHILWIFICMAPTMCLAHYKVTKQREFLPQRAYNLKFHTGETIEGKGQKTEKSKGVELERLTLCPFTEMKALFSFSPSAEIKKAEFAIASKPLGTMCFSLNAWMVLFTCTASPRNL